MTDAPAFGVPARAQRDTWMDTTRGVAVLLVAFGHAVFMTADAPGPLLWLVEFFRPFRIPTLLLLSGLLVERSLRKPIGAYLEGKWRFIVWPLVFWNLISWVLAPDPLPLTDPQYWLQPGYLWYLLYLAGYYVIGLLMRSVPPPIIVGLFAATWLLSLNEPAVSEFFRYGIFFFAGHWLSRATDGQVTPPRHVLLLCAGLAASTFGVLHTMDVVDYRHPLGVFAILLGIGTIVGVCALVDEAWQPRSLRWVGRNSLIFYTTHFPVVVVLVHLQAILWPAGGSWHWLVNFAGAIASCAVATAFQRFSWTRVPYRAPFPIAAPAGARIS